MERNSHQKNDRNYFARNSDSIETATSRRLSSPVTENIKDFLDDDNSKNIEAK
jgi:hypothetical protein